MATPAFRPALVVVDVQEDFCPPNGALAVPGGRDVCPVINNLLSLPFVFKVATRDWHPADHVSFAVNHPGASPFTSFHTIVHPSNPALQDRTRLWPVHCVAGSPGAQLIAELDPRNVHLTLDKGTDPRVEMYSAFGDPMGVSSTGLASRLRAEGVTHVYVVGLAFDYCVKWTAMAAAEEGFKVFIVEEGTRAIDRECVADLKRELGHRGVEVVGFGGEEVALVSGLKA